jgi:predicted RNA-binding Zn ribbon-like protein
MQTDHGFVPDDLLFLVDFLNSTYPGTDDHFGTAERFRAWLGGHGRPVAVTPDQLTDARALRNGLRAAAMGNAGVATDDAAIAMAEDALSRAGVRVSLVEGDRPLVPRGSGADAILGDVAVALATARLTRRWGRVKACAGADCGFVFWDGSRNASRRWCDMQRCGSRLKMRTYRAHTAHDHAGRHDSVRHGHDGADRRS